MGKIERIRKDIKECKFEMQEGSSCNVCKDYEYLLSQLEADREAFREIIDLNEGSLTSYTAVEGMLRIAKQRLEKMDK